MPKIDALRKAPTELRGPVARGLKSKGEEDPIDRDGGDYGAGIIRGFAVITKGEALGHDMWIDGDFLQQVADSINHRKVGIKSRFTHPGLSSDGMGKMLGHARDAYVDGDVTRADLHLIEAAHKAPDGDLASYVMDLAQESPRSFGTSIVFGHDEEAEAEFEAANHSVDGFKSPDQANKKNYPHARLKDLRAVDAVDSPAANPKGMFHRGHLADEAWECANYALGLTDTPPKVSAFDISPDRLRAFAARFLNEKGLIVMAKAAAKLNDQKPEETAPATSAAPTDSATPEGGTPAEPAKKPEDEKKPEGGKPAETQQSAKTGQDFIKAFGDKGAVWFVEGKKFEECYELHTKSLQTENDDLKKRLSQLKGGEETAPAFSGTDSKSENKTLSRLEQQLGEAGARFAASIVLPAKTHTKTSAN